MKENCSNNGGKITNYSVNTEFNCYFEFFPTVIIVIGIFWCHGIGREKGELSGKMALCSVNKEKLVGKKGFLGGGGGGKRAFFPFY